MTIKTIKAKDTESGCQNTYIVEGKDACILIDAGVPLDKVYQHTKLPLKALFITHCHYDHIEFIEEYNKLKIPIYVGPNAEMLMNDFQANASDLFNDSRIFVVENSVELKDGEQISIADLKIEAITSPGHSIDGMCYLVNDEDIFSGDTLFDKGIGRTDIKTGNIEDMKHSLEKLMGCQYINMYPGHGEMSVKKIQDTLIPKWIRYLNITSKTNK